ncbi:ribosomal protein S18 acetylase RimI-like enzyme [Kribbella sp. VKM Ac-2566]|nr:ribosomal protein S18 acetylase RimI-like enzyme [Kribbella sp. VKM Ac-2566]
MTMNWRPATAKDAVFLAELASVVSGRDFSADQASVFLRNWDVEIAEHDAAAVAVHLPTEGRGKGYGAWWVSGGSDRLTEIASRLVQLASATPGLSTLQVARPADEAVGDPRFELAYPLWTMVHDGTTWPRPRTELPAPLRHAQWSDVVPREFQSAYEQAYRDQRVVEPRDVSTWQRSADVSALAVSPDGRVAGFVLGFIEDHGAVELGPIGTVPSWRRRGVSSALLASVLKRCRELRLGPVTLTVDGDSPTGAQDIYLRHGFRITESLVAYQVRL